MQILLWITSEGHRTTSLTIDILSFKVVSLYYNDKIEPWVVDKWYGLRRLITSPGLTKELLASKTNTRGEQSARTHRADYTNTDIYTEITRDAWLDRRNGHWPWSSEDGSFNVQIQLRWREKMRGDGLRAKPERVRAFFIPFLSACIDIWYLIWHFIRSRK